MMRGPKKAVSILMPMELYTQIHQLAQESHRTMSAYIRQVLKTYLCHIQKYGPEEDWWRLK